MTLKGYSELILGVIRSKIPSVNSSIIYYKQACMDTTKCFNLGTVMCRILLNFLKKKTRNTLKVWTFTPFMHCFSAYYLPLWAFSISFPYLVWGLMANCLKTRATCSHCYTIWFWLKKKNGYIQAMCTNCMSIKLWLWTKKGLNFICQMGPMIFCLILSDSVTESWKNILAGHNCS